MNFIDLTMPLNYQWMPDEVLPTSVKFFFGPKDHQDLRSTTVATIPKGNQEEISRMDVEKVLYASDTGRRVRRGADVFASLEFARLGIMTVRKLVRCGRLKNRKSKSLSRHYKS